MMIEQPLRSLRDIIRGYGSVLVAYSGGVDSALVAVVAHQELGSRSLACIGVSPSYPRREREAAVELAKKMGIACRLVDTREGTDPQYAANSGDRCYFCKSELYRRLTTIAATEGFSVVADGVHTDDVADHQHGMRAGREASVRSPLREAGLGKTAVRAAAKHLYLPVWDKPAMPCLSSRVPQGVPITADLLRQIEAAEDAVAALGFIEFRVRHHGEVARLELPPEEFPRALDHREELLSGIRAAGYRFVTLDLAGLKSGSQGPQLVQLRVVASYQLPVPSEESAPLATGN